MGQAYEYEGDLTVYNKISERTLAIVDRCMSEGKSVQATADMVTVDKQQQRIAQRNKEIGEMVRELLEKGERK